MGTPARDAGGRAGLAAGLALALVLAALVPPFLRMPLCNDATLYDICARNVLAWGGTHYRECFDTNPPGMPWLHMAVRAPLGWSFEALRVADLAVVAGVVLLLTGWLRALGLSATARVAAAAVLCFFYLTTTEWCHCQRDTWMLLPCLAALELRRRQAAALTDPASTARGLALRALAEGLLWGAAFWIKPFVAVPGLFCWLLTAAAARREGRGARLLPDLAGLLAGGLVVGAAGCVWLWWSGSWPYFWDVMLRWNPEYAANASPLSLRLRYFVQRLTPWNLAHVLAIPLALGFVLRTVAGRARPPAPEAVLALPGAFYLGWLVQVLAFQKRFDYVLVPPVFLALTLVVGWARTVRPRRAAWRAIAGLVLLAPAHALFVEWLRWDDRGRPEGQGSPSALALAARRSAGGQLSQLAGHVAMWPRCWGAATPELRNRLTLLGTGHTPDWVLLERVAEFLEGRGLRHGELTCYNNSTHPLYLRLDLQPAVPYLHFDTTLAYFPGRRGQIREQLAASRQRYVVSDLLALGVEPDRPVEGRPPALPPDFPEEWRHLYPWDQPVVFRAGRYLVHEVTRPVGNLLPPSRPGSRAPADGGEQNVP